MMTSAGVTDCSLRRFPRQRDQLCNLALAGIGML
jgi:hypothetical protein